MNNYLKAIASALTAVVAVINIVLTKDSGGLAAADWQNIVSVVLGPVLVWLTPNLAKPKLPSAGPAVVVAKDSAIKPAVP